MASTFKNARAVLTASYADIYTCPAGTTAVVLNMHSANTSTTTSRDLSCQWLDASASNAATRLAEQMTIPAKEALALLNGKLVLEAGDKIQAKASAVTDVEMTVAVMELS